MYEVPVDAERHAEGVREMSQSRRTLAPNPRCPVSPSECSGHAHTRNHRSLIGTEPPPSPTGWGCEAHRSAVRRSVAAGYRNTPTFENVDDGALSFGKANELDADPDDVIRYRFCISHLTRDRDVEGGTELDEHRDATTQKFSCIGAAKVYPHTERRDVEDRALPPRVRWLVFDMATAQRKCRFAFYPSAILHVPSSSMSVM